MSSVLEGFVYGEDRDGPRSLGFSCLAPAAAPWAAEVEALARKLQACPYPETWPSAELFCSALLSDGRRLVGVARYGLRDHSPNPRGGGLELLGGVGPADLDVAQARGVAAWLARRRRDIDDPRSLAGAIALDAVPPVAPTPTAAGLAFARLADAGALLFTGTTAGQPDEQLGLLDRASPGWQWLPYCGPDFPFEAYAQRGPLIAWLPPRTDLAVLLSRPRTEAAPAAAAARFPLGWIVAGVLCLLAIFNVWAWIALPGRLPEPQAAPPIVVAPKVSKDVAPAATDTRERFAKALYDLAAGPSGGKFLADEEGLRVHYRRLLTTRPDLHCDNPQAQAMVAAISQLIEFDPDRVARIIVEEFADKKGYDSEVVRLISERVRQRLSREVKSGK